MVEVPDTTVWELLKWLFGGIITFLGWLVKQLLARVSSLEQQAVNYASHDDIEKVAETSKEETNMLRRDITAMGDSLRKEIREQVSFVVDVIRNK